MNSATTATVALIATVLIGCSPDKPLKKQFLLTEVIPTGQQEVEQLALRYSDRSEELAAKLQATVSTNRDWFLAAIKSTPDGEPMSYHTNFGLSEAEYKEYLEGFSTGHFVVAGHPQIVFLRRGDICMFGGVGSNSPLSKLKLNIKTGKIETSLGDIEASWKTSEREDTPIGPYEGYGWYRETGNTTEATVSIVSLDIWHVKKSGKIFWRFRDNATEQGSPTQQYEVLFQYNLK